MYFGDVFIDYRVEEAVFSCIAERGIDAVDMGAVAATLGRARSTLYAQYGSWRDLLTYTHGRALAGINALFACRSVERRAQFDDWWAALSDFLRGPSGIAFRALRVRLAIAALEDNELAQLPALVEWVGRAAAPFRAGAPSLARAAWLLALSAGSCKPHSPVEVDLRELVWSMAGEVKAAVSDEIEIDAVHALCEPLGSQH